MIKLIATDLDGTLLNDKGEIDKNFSKMLRLVNSNKIMFAPASGRHYGTLCKNFKEFGPDIILIGHNGAIIQYNNNGEILYENLIEKELMFKTVERLKNTGIDYDVYLTSKDISYVSDPSDSLSGRYEWRDVSIKKLSSLYDVTDRINKIGIFRAKGFTPEVVNSIKEAGGGNLEYEVGGDVWLDIMNKNINKGRAINILQKKFNIRDSETLVFGDNYNDISMFKAAYYSYAMDNASDEVKKHARFTAPDNNSNGVIKTINTYLEKLA